MHQPVKGWEQMSESKTDRSADRASKQLARWPRPRIKFSKCPIGKHKGELWDKLKGRALTEPAMLIGIQQCFSDEIPDDEVKADTFHDWTQDDLQELCLLFYRSRVINAIVLTFDHPDGYFTTIRQYTKNKYDYYAKHLGKLFNIEVQR